MAPVDRRRIGRPSRAVTVTLPEDVLKSLRNVDVDVGRAIVRLAERGSSVRRVRRVRMAELATYGNHAVIMVNPASALKRLPGCRAGAGGKRAGPDLARAAELHPASGAGRA